MKRLSERIRKWKMVLGESQEIRIPDHQIWADEVAQLEAELEVLRVLDVSGLKVVATELAKTKPPYRWSSIWRDCGIRQTKIGKQLLRLCAVLGDK